TALPRFSTCSSSNAYTRTLVSMAFMQFVSRESLPATVNRTLRQASLCRFPGLFGLGPRASQRLHGHADVAVIGQVEWEVKLNLSVHDYARCFDHHAKAPSKTDATSSILT